MGKKKQPKVQYVGPSAQEIQAQQASQAQMFAQLQAESDARLQQQLTQVTSAYNTQLELLNQQATQQAEQQAGILSSLQQQLDLTRTSAQDQSALLSSVLPGIQRQEGLMAALQAAATTREGEARGSLLNQANISYNTASQRRQVRQQQASSRGVGLLSSITRTGDTQSLLR